MNESELISKGYEVLGLTPNLVRIYASDICESLDQIPEVDQYTEEKLLQERKEERELYKKWDHSFILLDHKKFVGIIIGYERIAENNEQYQHNSIYLSELAISKAYQRKGLGKLLIKTWLDKNKNIKFLELNGDLRFSVQTNFMDWNKHVQKLYQSFGFKKISEKKYDNRTDNVYFLEV